MSRLSDIGEPRRALREDLEKLSSNNHFVEMKEDEFVKEAIGLVEKAQSRGVHLRILGSLGAYVRSVNNGYGDVFRSLERFGGGKPLFTDLDLLGYNKQKGDITKFLRELNFKPDALVNAMFGNKRLVFYHPDNKYHVDIFLNKLEFSHTVDFGDKPGSGRLELDYPTISATDIALEKLQIHEINRKDLIDLIALFLVHDVHEQFSKEVVDGGHIGKMLSDDWGFWYDATTNLGKLKPVIDDLLKEGKITAAQSQIAMERVEKLLQHINKTPKSKGWEKRAKTGTSKRWYTEVEEIVR